VSSPTPTRDAITELLDQGRFGAAESALRALLETDPGDSRALRLLGTVCHVGGRGEEARSLLQRALDLEPDHTSTLLNLGSVHLAAGNTTDATACFTRVVELDAGSADGYFNLGLAAQQAGEPEQAMRAYSRALELDDSLLDAAANLAVVHFQQGRLEESLAASRRVLARQPDHPQAFLLHLRTLLALSRLQQAEQRLAAAPASLHSEAGFHAIAGRLHFLGGRLDEAAAAYSEARGRGDTRLDTSLDLARCLLESGDPGTAIDVLLESARRHSDSAECHALLGLAHIDAGQFGHALAAYDAAIGLDPDSADHHAMRGHALYSLGQGVQAEQAVDRAIAMAPAVVSPHLMRVEQRVARGDLPGALDACQRYLSRQGAECSLPHSMIDPPEGYADLDEFNAALARHVRAHPSLSHGNAASRATQIGRQSGNLFQGDQGPFVDFERILWSAATRYREAVGRDPGHPFLARPPELGAVYSWAVVLERSGYQTPHIHPTAWLSGVYYPELPAAISAGGSEQGWIEFGAPPPEFVLEPAAPTLRIQPREGLLVLFPSYFYHRTIPCDSDEQRISIAFDFSPKRA
jgi:uncharacterized protein (TIGR02466 family)